MKILNIQSANFNTSLNNKISAKPHFFKENKDILDINFTSQKKDKPSQEFIETIADKDLREDIVENIIKDNNGKYQKDIEEMFLFTYQNFLEQLVEEGDELTDELKTNSQIATADVFETLRQEDGSIDTEQNIPFLIFLSLNAIEEKIPNYQEAFKESRNKSGKINEPMAGFLIQNKIRFPRFSFKHLKHMTRYLVDPTTKN